MYVCISLLSYILCIFANRAVNGSPNMPSLNKACWIPKWWLGSFVDFKINPPLGSAQRKCASECEVLTNLLGEVLLLLMQIVFCLGWFYVLTFWRCSETCTASPYFYSNQEIYYILVWHWSQVAFIRKTWLGKISAFMHTKPLEKASPFPPYFLVCT